MEKRYLKTLLAFLLSAFGRAKNKKSTLAVRLNLQPKKDKSTPNIAIGKVTEDSDINRGGTKSAYSILKEIRQGIQNWAKDGAKNPNAQLNMNGKGQGVTSYNNSSKPVIANDNASELEKRVSNNKVSPNGKKPRGGVSGGMLSRLRSRSKGRSGSK